MEEHFFKERGIYYRTNDFRSGRVTLVLIHGLSGSSSAWFPFERAWEHEFNVLSFDLRGHGKSLKPDGYESYEMEPMVEDIVRLMDSLGVEEYIPLSQSFGVLLAVKLLKRKPNARAAVFMSSIYGIYNHPLTRLSRALIGVCAVVVGMFRYPLAPGRHIDYDKFRHAGDWNMRRIFKDIPNTTWHVWLYCLDHLYSQDLDPLWRDITVPSLIMHGQRDSISPVRYAEQLSKDMPHAELKLLPTGSHVFPLTHVDEALRLTTEYLKKQSG